MPTAQPSKSERLMHMEREKHNKKLCSYRLTFTSYDLLLLLRKMLRGRNRSWLPYFHCLALGVGVWVCFYAFQSLPHLFFSKPAVKCK